MIIETLVRQFELTKHQPVIRVFHGPGTPGSLGELENLAIDRFQNHYWVHYWATDAHQELSEVLRSLLVQFFRMIKAHTAVLSLRPFRGSPEPPTLIVGMEMPKNFIVQEPNGVQAEIRFENMRHPGLFLDHAPLRDWLVKESKGKTVLNTFSYTGALSTAAALGGATQVTTLDLSKATLEWAKRNAEINNVSQVMNEFVAADFFEFAKRANKTGKKWDIVILDPPSFSRSKSGTFSTKKDLIKLHFAAFGILSQNGTLITSINSENITRSFFYSKIEEAAHQAECVLTKVKEIKQPESFTTDPKRPETAYLKGWILRVKFLGKKNA